MIVSKYTYIFKSEKNGYLLYNSRTNCFAEISQKLYNSLNCLKDNPDRLTEVLSEKEIITLSNSKIIVEKGDDEEFVLFQKMQYYLSAFSQTSLNLTIAPTTECNFICPYCYEKDKPKQYITEKVEDDILEFIKLHKSTDKIRITWYGGEPLLAFDKIKRLFDKISNIKGKTIVSHSIVTNGYLIDEEKCDYFNKHNLNSIQFTLDGARETHNQTRMHKDRSIKTYDKIIDNIELCGKKMPNTLINVRVHVDNDRKGDFAKVYKELAYLREDYNVHISPGFITNYQDNCILMSNLQMGEFFQDLYLNHGCDISFYPQITIGGCCATHINSYVIGPRGELYKCWVDVGRDDRIIGNVGDKKLYNENLLANYMVNSNMYDDERCKQCFFLPVCGGGCPYRRLKSKKEGRDVDLCPDNKDNLKEYLEKHFEIRMSNKTNTISKL